MTPPLILQPPVADLPSLRRKRAVYTVKFAGVVYVLHAFQKKSKSGIKTPPSEIDKVRSRLKEAESHYAKWKERQKSQEQH